MGCVSVGSIPLAGQVARRPKISDGSGILTSMNPGETVFLEEGNYEEFVNLYSNFCYRLAVGNLRNKEDAEEATGTVMWRLWPKAQVGFQMDSPRVYLATAIRNACNDIRRR